MALLRGHGIGAVADVRRYPRSRRNPQFNLEALRESLAAAGIRLESFAAALGGRRRARRDSPNEGWEMAGFRGYADHMASDVFVSGLEALEVLGGPTPTAIMCAESDWRRCHRRLIADALTARCWRVLHIGARGEIVEHQMTPFAVADAGRVWYPAIQQPLA